MKKFFNSFKFILKAFLLVLILLLGWVFINVTNLIKGKKLSEKDSVSKNMFGTDGASADAPGGGGACIGPPGCPHIAAYNGKVFRIENDFLPSEFKTLEPRLANIIYKWNNPAPDMLKLSSSPQKYNGALTLRLLEIEPEESFIHRIKFLRVVHSKDEEVVIDAAKKEPYLVSKKEFEKELVFPSNSVLNAEKSLDGLYARNKRRLWGDIAESRDDLFQKGDSVEFVFQNIEKNKDFLLVLRSVYRDYMVGEKVKEHNFFSAFTHSFAFAKIAAFGGLYFLLKGWLPADSLAFLPFIIGSGSMCKSIVFSYRNAFGKFIPLVVQKPRSFRHGTEVVSLPKESVGEDGSLVVRANFTKRHRLSFIGVAKAANLTAAIGEELSIKKALHSRLGDVSLALKGEEKKETHLIPGDTVEVSFENPARPIGFGQKETYLLESSGFYTALRPEYKKLAGNWQDKLSNEAKKHLASLVNLKDYA
ncbi:MAG: hypothetical protein Q7K16_01990 [Candidatus Azambacteria bacterium]|nr:hypothetical protein [Candidatus Azambacteria bacterium]